MQTFSAPTFTDEQRRHRLVRRHHLAGDADGVLAAVAGVGVLHATDPATVYLSVLARCASATLADVATELYERRSLLRLLAMRRTLFVVPAELAPVVHAGAALEIAAMIRKRLLSQLTRLPTEPAVPSDPTALAAWLADVERGTAAALERLGTATGAQLSAAEPRLRTAMLPTTDKSWDVKQNITSQVLTMMAAEGRMLRTEPRGDWTSRHHSWEPSGDWPLLDPAQARCELVGAYLRAFAPVTEADVAWWTGWSLRQTRTALAGAGAVEVSLSSGPGLVPADDPGPETDPPVPVATLLPALDPTPMGWKQRDWFSPDDPSPLYDRNGNIGPTVWWDGEIVGGWSVTTDGTVVSELILDRGAEAARAVAAATAALQPRLEGARVLPSFPTPLEKKLRLM